MDLSADYAVVDDAVSVYYRPKLADGDPLSTRSASYFQAAPDTSLIVSCQRNAVTRTDKDWFQKDAVVFHIWKAACPDDFTPKAGDALFQGGDFWVVREIGYCDRDANGPQRFRLICEKSKAKVTA